ncbi:hypothetical protein [Lutibacter sp.]|uniref:hypothetical protein n=1 Tax=Lutibacter sp. TaxID=1925666 RepID=UPI0035649CF7
MKLLKKIFIISLNALLFNACIANKKPKVNLLTEKEKLPPIIKKETPNSISIETSTNKNINYLNKTIEIENHGLLDENVLNKIKTYYYNEYAKEWKAFKKEHNSFKKYPSTETKTDSVFDLVFKYLEGDIQYSATMIHCKIPLKQEINLYMSSPILYTDLDNDGTNDLIVVVHTEGGWRGGNTYSQDIFTFLLKKGAYTLTNVTTDWELAKPKGYGYIRVKNAENGILLAEASIYTENDARCCPSEHYYMKYKFKNNRYVNISSDFIGSDY